MIILNVEEILEKKGKSKYWLWSQMKMTYTNFDAIISNQRKSIKYKNIEILCDILECEPNDLFKRVDDDTTKEKNKN